MSDSREVRLKYGVVKGSEEDESVVYKGIPYARPPVGALRFCPPQEAEPWNGVLCADSFPNRNYMPVSDGKSFYDKEFYWDPKYETPYSEDCLYLNIWQPKNDQKAPFPVAFWIHGGGYDHGYGHEMEFDGAEYNKRGVLLVTFNYRVGVLGFLAHPWLSQESEEKISGNYGLLDQIFALKWVRENISSFGGDPDNITVFGQSAGAVSAQILTTSPLTENWISKAIFQSGLSYYTGVFSNTRLAEAEQTGSEFTKYCGIGSLDELRSIAPEKLLEYQIAFSRLHPDRLMCFSPNIDNHLLTEDLEKSVEKGSIKNISYMLGSTKDDVWVTTEILDRGEKGPLYESIEAWSRKVIENSMKAPYVYYFTRDLPGDDAGSFHSAELWYTFGTLSRSSRPMGKDDYVLSREMLDAWTEFMKSGSPGNGWECYDKIKIFDVPVEFV